MFPVSGRLLRQQDDATRLAKKNQVELLARLKRLEGVVEDLTSQLKTPVEGGGSDTGGLPGSQQEDDDVVNLEEEVGRLVIDESGSRYVGNRFWVAFQEEVRTICGLYSKCPFAFFADATLVRSMVRLMELMIA